ILDNVAFGIFVGSTFAPVTLITLGTLDPRDISDGSTLLNVVRLIAGSVGTAYSTAVMTQRTSVFYEALASNVTWTAPGTTELLARLGWFGGPGNALFDPDGWARLLSVAQGLMLRRAASYAFHATYGHLAVFAVAGAVVVAVLRSRRNATNAPIH
ncbi:MAG: hypothetical protein D6788_09665, partial [Planctomycetota bacterium]